MRSTVVISVSLGTEILNAHISEFTPSESVRRFMEVLQTGVPKYRTIEQLHEKEFIASRIPLKEGGQIIGVMGLIHFDIKDADQLSKTVFNLENQLEFYKEQIRALKASRYTFEDILGTSEKIKGVKQKAKQLAKLHSSVLLLGESGTGKELFASAIHNHSPRRYGEFVQVNCSAIPQELLESELFGYEAGSFSGAKKRGKKGKFELADNGTMFLDEIGDMPLGMQSKLLRVLQGKEIDKIGGTKPLKVDFRLVAATNRNLEELVEMGLFRSDLFYRINVVPIELPPLRGRLEDIPVLAKHFLGFKAKEIGVRKINLAPSAIKELQSYHFPGNVRELMNILERIISSIDPEQYSDNELTITKAEVPTVGYSGSPPKKRLQQPQSLKAAKHHQEIDSIREAIQVTGGNLTKCSALLGIHRVNLYRKIRLHNLQTEVLRARKNKIESALTYEETDLS